MKYCTHCGRALSDTDRFCTGCGAPAQVAPAPTPVAPMDADDAFLETTRRLLRWEQKAWRIQGIVLVVIGAVYASLCGLLALGFSAEPFDDSGLGFISVFYAVVSLAMFGGPGLIGVIAARKIEPYLFSFDVAPHAAIERCRSIGMLVFTCLFGFISFDTISAIFFIINFVRLRACSETVGRILARPRRQYFK